MHPFQWLVLALLLLMGLLVYRPKRRVAKEIPAFAGPVYAFNRTRQTFLANRLRIANTHLGRLRGLMLTSPVGFSSGAGLWIVPCHGVHTIAMRYAIDVVYLDESKRVVHVEENVRPWRLTPIRLEAATIIELPAHTVYNTGTNIGDAVEIDTSVVNEREHGNECARPAC